MSSTAASTRCAKVVKRYGCTDDGRFGVRGFSSHCPECGDLSRIYNNIRGAQDYARRHRCPDTAGS